ncbi:hypothetical protein WA026_019053 [Henosepilachna vigintioctopunctata]|uniref:Exoribonuclease phosphorolytic domain-containing protein n=1 Tax=Henosepilachna vigintioctopunctata TaxID=420089 RepID=A0AAW1VGP0_9CUCU
MPVDHKRINAPESAVPYKLFTKLNTESLKEQYQKAIRDGIRVDGRKPSEHRKIFLKTGIVAHAKGSAYIEQGNTKVVTSVFDPREIPNRTDYCLKGEIYCEFKFAPFSCPKRRLHQQDSQEKECSAIMKKALEAVVCREEFPNFQVDVYALVLHNDGSALSAAVTAAGVALASAGIPMFDIITSSTLAIQGEHSLFDPNFREELLSEIAIEKEHGVVILCVTSTHQQISHFHQTGNLQLNTITQSIDTLHNTCKEIVPVVQKCLVKSVLSVISES